MKTKALLAVSLLSLLAGCGGSSDSVSNDSLENGFMTRFNAVARTTGIDATSVSALLASDYLDGGVNKQQVMSNLAADSSAVSAYPTQLSAAMLYPNLVASSVTVSNCNGSGVCDLNVTYTNPDAEGTQFTVTTLGKVVDRQVQLLGDQSAS